MPAAHACLITTIDVLDTVPQVTVWEAWIVAAAATSANLFESFMGAALQGHQGSEWLSNDVVNMIQISVAAALAIACSLKFGQG